MNGLTSTWGPQYLIKDPKSIVLKMGYLLEGEIPNTIDIFIDGCPRCRKPHKGLEVKKFSAPVSDVEKGRHPIIPAYCICPNTGEPVMLVEVVAYLKEEPKDGTTLTGYNTDFMGPAAFNRRGLI